MQTQIPGLPDREVELDRDSCSTPKWVIDLAREILGDIDLDPATNEAAQRVVGATTYYTAEDDGLSQEWSGRTWLNPPFSQPLIVQFTRRLVQEHHAGRVPAAIVLTNSATETDWWQHLARHCDALVFPSKRIQFWHPTEDLGDQNRHAQTFFYFGTAAARFVDVMRRAGMLPMLPFDDPEPQTFALDQTNQCDLFPMEKR